MKRLQKEDKAGLYITVIVHLTVIIVLLATQLNFSLRRENSFVLDFTKAEQLEKLQQQLEFKQQIADKLQQMIDGGGSTAVRNLAVDRSSLKDDRNTDADKLYKDAERLQKELAGGSSLQDEDYVEEATPKKEKSKDAERKYSGPSVVSWNLDGRKASHLSIPAYRCMGAGEVTVIIGVDNNGNVVSATIKEDVSSIDKCLRNFAIRAARLSKFSKSTTAPSKQMGDIVYKFIAQ